MSNELLNFEYVYIFIFIFIYICFADAVKSFHLEIFRLFFQFTFKIQAFPQKGFQVTLKVQAFSSKLLHRSGICSKILPRSDIFFQVTSKIRHFLPSYFQDQIFSCKILKDQTFYCKILQDQTLSSKIFQDTCKNNALSSKILEVKSDRFLQEMYGSSTGVKKPKNSKTTESQTCLTKFSIKQIPKTQATDKNEFIIDQNSSKLNPEPFLKRFHCTLERIMSIPSWPTSPVFLPMRIWR